MNSNEFPVVAHDLNTIQTDLYSMQTYLRNFIIGVSDEFGERASLFAGFDIVEDQLLELQEDLAMEIMDAEEYAGPDGPEPEPLTSFWNHIVNSLLTGADEEGEDEFETLEEQLQQVITAALDDYFIENEDGTERPLTVAIDIS